MRSRRAFLAVAALGLAGCSATTPGGTDEQNPPDDDTPDSTTSERPPPSSAEPQPPTGDAVQWRLDTGAAVGAPRVHDGTVYAVGGTNERGTLPDRARNGPDQHSQNVLAVTPTGDVAWRYEAAAPVDELVPVEGGVYATVGWSTGLSGFDTRVLRVSDGASAFESDAVDSFLSVLDHDQDGVYVGTHDDALGTNGERIFALARDGTKQWDVEAGDAFAGTLHDGRLYVGSGGGRMVRARDARTGEVLWDRAREPVGDVRVGDGVLYVDGGQRADGHYPLCAISAADGSDQWCAVSDGVTDGPFVPTAAVRAGDTVVGTEYDGLVFGLDAADGSERWHYDLSGRAGDLAVHDGVAYVADEGGSLHAVGVEAGERRWRTAVPGRPGGLAVTEKAVVVETGGKAGGGLVGFDHAGDERWRFSHPRSLSGLAVAGDVAFVGTDSGYLAALGP